LFKGEKGSGYLGGYSLLPIHYSWSQRGWLHPPGTHFIGTGAVGDRPNLSTWSQCATEFL